MRNFPPLHESETNTTKVEIFWKFVVIRLNCRQWEQVGPLKRSSSLTTGRAGFSSVRSVEKRGSPSLKRKCCSKHRRLPRGFREGELRHRHLLRLNKNGKNAAEIGNTFAGPRNYLLPLYIIVGHQLVGSSSTQVGLGMGMGMESGLLSNWIENALIDSVGLAA